MNDLSKYQEDFLYLLAFLYLQQSKYDLALQLFRILRLHTARDIKIALALAVCLYKEKHLEEAQKVMRSINESALPKKLHVVFYYINSKILWDLNQKEASRDMLYKYLKIRAL